jgi:hypothetical protein
MAFSFPKKITRATQVVQLIENRNGDARVILSDGTWVDVPEGETPWPTEGSWLVEYFHAEPNVPDARGYRAFIPDEVFEALVLES